MTLDIKPTKISQEEIVKEVQKYLEELANKLGYRKGMMVCHHEVELGIIEKWCISSDGKFCVVTKDDAYYAVSDELLVKEVCLVHGYRLRYYPKENFVTFGSTRVSIQALVHILHGISISKNITSMESTRSIEAIKLNGDITLTTEDITKIINYVNNSIK